MIVGKLNRRVLIERKVVTRDPVYKSEVVTWVAVATVWATVTDVVGKGRESIIQSTRVRSQPTRVYVRYRADLKTDMRVTDTTRNRLYQIVNVAEFGNREGLELLCEEYSS